MTWESEGMALLFAALVRPFALAAVAWLVLRALRVRHPASKHAVWTAVLAGMLLLPVVSALAPHWKLRLLPSTPQPARVAVAVPSATPAIETTDSATVQRSDEQVHTAPATLVWPSAQIVILACYAVGLIAMLVYRAAGWLLLRRVVARSSQVRGRWLRESDDVLAPVAVGLLRPMVILPRGWRAWSLHTRRVILAHEFAHLRRRDAAVSALARLAQSVLWFHPLAWWVSRKVSELAELACDAAALEKTDDPAGYSRILLEFADVVNRAGRRVSMPGLAMAAASGMGRRIDQVFELSAALSTGTLRKLAWPAGVAAALTVPVLCLAATIGFVERTGAVATPAAPQSSITPPAVAPHRPDPIPDLRRLQIQVAQAAPTPALGVLMSPQNVVRPAPSATPKFDVVSVKPCKESDMAAAAGKKGGRGGGRIDASPGRLSMSCQTVDNLIRTAYLRFPTGKPIPIDPATGLQIFPMSMRLMQQTFKGGPAWLESDRFTIDATAEGAPSREMMIGPMMQTLLADRFKLKIRRESSDVPVYALTVAKGGPKLQAAEAGKCMVLDPQQLPATPTPGQEFKPICGAFRHMRTGADEAYSETMSGFVDELSRLLDLDVIDKTGIAGRFDIHLELSLADLYHGLSLGPSQLQQDVQAAVASATDPPGSTVFPAVHKLGLNLEHAKAPAELLVIDHVEKPSGN